MRSVLSGVLDGIMVGQLSPRLCRMAASKPTLKAVQFGVFELDPEAGELRKRGMLVKLQEQPFQLLAVLIERAGEVVTKDDLRQRLWPSDTFVDFDHGLHSAITRLREALGDSSESPRFIETVPRRGYRFVAQVTGIDKKAQSDVAVEQPISSPGAQPGKGARPGKFGARILAGLLSGALLLVILLGLNVRGFRRWLLRESNPPTGAQITSLAVLPLEDLSGGAKQDYFADGITDELITSLAKINSIEVISRTSTMQYKGVHQKLSQIARELGVDGIVEGTIVRSGDRIRMTAQLIYAPADRHVWAERYDRDARDIPVLENEIARTIAQQIRGKLSSEQERRFTANPIDTAAHEAYLQGRYYWNKRNQRALWEAVRYFEQAIEKDPRYAPAYVGLADAYNVLGSWGLEALPPQEAFGKSRAAAEKAFQLEPDSAEVHTALSSIRVFDRDLRGAEMEYQRALQLNPNYVPAHQWYSQYLCKLGRFDECLVQAQRAHALDPSYVIAAADVGYRLYWARRYRDAIPPLQKTIEFNPDFGIAHRWLGQNYEGLGMYSEAITELQKAGQLSDGGPIDLGALGHAYGVSGQRMAARNILHRLEELGKRRYVSGYDKALVYVGLGEKDRALESLEAAFREQSTWMLHLKVDPRLDPLRADAHFTELMRRLGLTE